MTSNIPGPSLHFHHACFNALHAGPRLIVTGAVHGNEICGTQAIRRLIGDIHAGRVCLASGQLTLVPVTNPLAHALGQRGGARNLNRALYPREQVQEFEDQVANWLCPLLARHDILLDLHSFHTAGEAFVMVGPEDNDGTLEPFAQAAREEALALRLGVSRFVDGWLDTYARGVQRRMQRHGTGTGLNTDVRYGVGTTEYMRSTGGCALTLECGQHADPTAPEVAYRAILNTLAHLGMIEAEAPQPAQRRQSLRIHDVIDRDTPADHFAREWKSFDRLHAGELIGTRGDGRVVQAAEDGYILFPNPKAEPGNEWFYLAKDCARLRDCA